MRVHDSQAYRKMDVTREPGFNPKEKKKKKSETELTASVLKKDPKRKRLKERFLISQL